MVIALVLMFVGQIHQNCATTFSVITLSIKTLSTMTFRITTLSILETKCSDECLNYVHYARCVLVLIFSMLSAIMLNVIVLKVAAPSKPVQHI